MSVLRFCFRRIAAAVSLRHALPLILLLAGLGITFILWRAASESAAQSAQSGFVFRAREANENILQHLRTYEELLHGTAGLFAASVSVERDEFRAYIDALLLPERYPGIQGMGYMLKLPTDTRAHEAAMHKEGFDDYRVWPPARDGMRTAVVYLEPFSGRNMDVLGYDAYTDATRRDALLQSMDSGKIVVTGKVRLVQENEHDVQSGFLMYLPVYRNHVPHDTVEQRRTNITGWIYAAFRMNNLMRDIRGLRGKDDLDIKIYDGVEFSGAALLYDSNPRISLSDSRQKLRYDAILDTGNHRWIVVATAHPTDWRTAGYTRAHFILWGGVGISLLLSLLAWSFLRDRAHALEAADRAYHLALYDTLTGLPNRQLAIERLTQSLAHARRNGGKVGLLFVDLDKFKPVNDQYGHAVGDMLLRAVAKRIRECVRDVDTAARVGGDEFVVLLPDIDGKSGAGVVAEKIREAMALPFEIADHHLEIAASIGVALYPDDARDENDLLLRADRAMYHAKHGGRNAVRFVQEVC